MGRVGTARYTAAASRRRLFTTRHSCHHKTVAMDKRFKDALDQTPPFDFGQNPRGRQMSGSKQVADSFLPVDDTKHCQRFHRPTREMVWR